MKTAPTASILKTTSQAGRVRHIAQVREIDGARTYLGAHPTREQAEQACVDYMATGRRPEPKKRGPKPGQQKRAGSMTRWGTPVLLDPKNPARPLPTAERLARNQAKGVPESLLAARKPVSAGQDTREAAGGPISRLELIRRIAGRLA